MTVDGFVCAHGDRQVVNGLIQWPRGTVITYWIAPNLGLNVDDGQAASRIANAIESWKIVSGANLQRTGDKNAARIICQGGLLDKSARILGETELPVGDETGSLGSHTLTLNTAVRWTLLELHQCVIHEAGHGIGLEHSPNGTIAIMSAVLNPTIDVQQPWDVSQAQLRCGPPVQVTPMPPMPVPDPTTDDGSLVFNVPGIQTIGGRNGIISVVFTPRD